MRDLVWDLGLSGGWLPGGTMDIRETFAQCVIRETKEGTGFDVLDQEGVLLLGHEPGVRARGEASSDHELPMRKSVITVRRTPIRICNS